MCPQFRFGSGTQSVASVVKHNCETRMPNKDAPNYNVQPLEQQLFIETVKDHGMKILCKSCGKKKKDVHFRFRLRLQFGQRHWEMNCHELPKARCCCLPSFLPSLFPFILPSFLPFLPSLRPSFLPTLLLSFLSIFEADVFLIRKGCLMFLPKYF